MIFLIKCMVIFLIKCHLSEKDCQSLVLLSDELKGQVQEDFKAAVFSENGFLWYGLPDATDLCQPLDTEYASCLKSFVVIEHQK